MEPVEVKRNSVIRAAKSITYRYPALTVAIISVAVPIIAGFTIGGSLEELYRRPYYLGIASTLAVIVASLVWMFRETLSPSIQTTWIQIRRIDPMWLLVLVAIIMRHTLLQFLPPDFAAFEEVQQGRMAYNIANLGEALTFHMLFTNALSAIGFALFGQDLVGLRTAFEIANSIAILLVAIGLRRLKVGWIGTLAAVFIMATVRWAVIAAGFAEESFGPTVLVALLLVSLIYSDTSIRNNGFWAAIAGLTAGLLFYAYVPWTFLVPLPVAFWFFRAWFAKTRAERVRTTHMSLWYIAVFSIVCAPLISQFIFDIRATHLGDRFLAHDVVERTTGVDVYEYLKQWLGDTVDNIAVVLGAETQRGSTLFRASHESMIPMIVGIAFGAGVLNALLRPRSILIFHLGVTVFVFSILIAVPSDRFFLGRLTPMLPILILTTGVLFDQLINTLDGNLWHRLPNIKVIVTVFVVIAIVVNVLGVLRMADDESTLKEYLNNNYIVCKPIGEQPFKFKKVVTVSEANCEFNDEIWVYRDTDFEAENSDKLPAPHEIEPGTLLVVGNRDGLPDEAISQITELADVTGNAETVLMFETLLERVGTVTFCHQCERLTDQ